MTTKWFQSRKINYKCYKHSETSSGENLKIQQRVTYNIIDFKNAFDTVGRIKMIKILKELKIPKKMEITFKNVCQEYQNESIIPKNYNSKFGVNEGENKAAHCRRCSST